MEYLPCAMSGQSQHKYISRRGLHWSHGYAISIHLCLIFIFLFCPSTGWRYCIPPPPLTTLHEVCQVKSLTGSRSSRQLLSWLMPSGREEQQSCWLGRVATWGGVFVPCCPDRPFPSGPWKGVSVSVSPQWECTLPLRGTPWARGSGVGARPRAREQGLLLAPSRAEWLTMSCQESPFWLLPAPPRLVRSQPAIQRCFTSWDCWHIIA